MYYIIYIIITEKENKLEEKLKTILKKKKWKFPKCNELKPFIKFVEEQTKQLNLDSRAEYIHHLKNNFQVTNHICKCGNKKKFRGTPDKRYGEFCSTKCSNIAQAKDKDKQLRKSESCKKHYQKNDTAKIRGEKVSNFYSNLKTEDPELYEKYRLKKDQTLRNIWGSFDEKKMKEIKEKMSKSSKEWYKNLPQETKNKIIDACNKGFNYFIDNMSNEEAKLYYQTAQNSREENNIIKYRIKYPNQLTEIKEKIRGQLRETLLKEYGVEHVINIPGVKEKIRETNEKNGNWMTEENIQNFKDYSKSVWRYTRKQPLHMLENIELRGHANQGKYHLDHKFSIFEGYKQGIPPEIIGNMINLEMILGRNNLKKQKKCSITLEELLKQFEV
jgi:hypothetical protein